jgi:UDP-N-acetylglucosamine 4-epimerase
MSRYEETTSDLRNSPKTWLVTGVAGFIGSNLLENLLLMGQRVVGLDNLSTGHQQNLEGVREIVGEERWRGFCFHQGCITDLAVCRKACDGVDLILHQAALGSVPRSIGAPLPTHGSNVTGFANMLWAAKEAGVRRFVFASSSSVYGDSPRLPKVEEVVGKCLSPYALSKWTNELYADVYARCYGLECIGLRYFNVFGPRQDPEGAYAAVIPKWVSAMITGSPIQINGDGETSRDFCYVKNVVQANILAATSENPEALNQAYNVAVGGRTTLNQLLEMLRSRLQPQFPHLSVAKPEYRDFRAGDVRHSQADISKISRLLGYQPTHSIEQGLDEALAWYVKDSR